MIALRQSGVVSLKVIVWLAIPVLIVAVIAGGRLAMKHRYEHARTVWKDEALAQIGKTSMTNEQVLAEIAEISAN
jgi:hypothetical protein